MHSDDRGSFTEFLRAASFGQVSVNVSKPGIVKGNHYHQTKHEKFLVVEGRGVISLRLVGGSKVIVYPVCGQKPEVVDIPPGYTHAIKNTGEGEMITIIWANEPFDRQSPDTFHMEV